MNIVIGRVGTTIKFKGFKRGNKSGLDTDMILYSTMSQMNPDYNFYFIGPSDFYKLTEEEYNQLFPCHNVYSPWIPELRKTRDFSKIIKYFDDNKISDFKFTPIINGYEITYNEYIIVIKHRLFGGINIRRYKNGIFEIGKNFFSHSPQDNDVIISDII